MTPGLTNPYSLFDVKGKVAIVTGASGAFGALAAQVLAAAGAKLVLTAGKAKELEYIAAKCREIGAEVEPLNKRPSSEAGCEAIVEAAKHRFSRVDILVVASGKNDVSKIVEMAPERFLDVMDANVTQSWLIVRAVGKQMLAQGEGGKIVLMSSARGLLGHPAGYSAYLPPRPRSTELRAPWVVNGDRLASPSMRLRQRCFAHPSPHGCSRTMKRPRRRVRASCRASQRVVSASQKTSPARCSSSLHGLRISIPAIRFMRMAATPQVEGMPPIELGHSIATPAEAREILALKGGYQVGF